jgi:hypothetical protein
LINSVPFNYFGKPRNLKFGMDAIRSIELQLGGISLSYLFQHQEKLGFHAICVMLSEGLKHEDQTMSVEKVSRWIEKYINEHKGETLLTIMPKFESAILEAIRESGLFGDLKGDEEEIISGNQPTEVTMMEKNVTSE